MKDDNRFSETHHRTEYETHVEYYIYPLDS